MEKFEDYFKPEFKEEYKEYCMKIQTNLTLAYYDYYILKNIDLYLKRSRYESFSLMFVEHLVYLLYQDIDLSLSRITFQSKGQNTNYIIRNLNSLLFQNTYNEVKLKEIFKKSKSDGEEEKIQQKKVKKIGEAINSYRNNFFAHSLKTNIKVKLYLEELKEYLDYYCERFNEMQFIVDDKSFYLYKEEIEQLEENAKEGIKGALKSSTVLEHSHND